MPFRSSLAVVTLVIAAITSSSDALGAFASTASSLPLPSLRQQSSTTTTLSYSNGNESNDENLFLPQQLDPSKIRRPSSWRIPQRQRAVPSGQQPSKLEAAARAGFIVQRASSASAKPDYLVGNRNSDIEHSKLPTEKKIARARPLRTIRRIVLRQQNQPGQLEQGVLQPNIITPTSNTGLTLSNHPQLDEILDKSDLSNLPAELEQHGGARRVTFKATKVASKALSSKPYATLTDFMTQPVSQYSLLSYHDAEGMSSSTNESSIHQSMSRRWLIRRLTKDESRVYITDSPSSSSSSDDTMEESNLFRLAVPLLPLIGWDLTPVIDLEVVPPKDYNDMKRSKDRLRADYGSLDGSNVTSATTTSSSHSSWAPLQGIRKRINHRGTHHESNRENFHSTPSPVVRIRSLRVSLLSTQKEVNEIMMNKSKSVPMNQRVRRSRGGNSSSTTMQREAIEMVGRVEEWLKPHITFEAEISWNDVVHSSSARTSPGHTNVVVDSDDKNNDDEVFMSSNVTVKSTAITSLTVPKIPSNILRKSVPSSFLVKRLGATLTSRALAVCLPRFLTQLEKDYNRWSGL
jgi:hypothetical protein